jgi:hypothetical protein
MKNNIIPPKAWLFLFFISLLLKSYPQANFSIVIPPSPNAASLAKFTDFPVSLYNGIPEINIPIWTIKEGECEMPVSLSYHAGGIKVEEIPSWVGLGWTLNAGGVITRSVHGKPDEGAGGYAYGAEKLKFCPDSNSAYFIKSIIQGEIDAEPDEFFYNFCGRSGKFVFDQYGKCHTVPYQKIVIIPAGTSGFESFTITTEDGIQYLFSEREYEIAGTTMNDLITGESSASQTTFYNSWYLKRIIFPNRPQSFIEFSYSNSDLFYKQQNTESFYISNASKKHPITYSDMTIWDSKRISLINYPGGSVSFTSGAYRHDLQGSQVLDKIIIKDKSGTTLKNFILRYNYFSGSGMTEFTALAAATSTTIADTRLRLSLKSIQEYDGTMSQSLNPYAFSYENSVYLPDRISSKAQDHWGFYNGETSNTTLIPVSLYKNSYSGGLRNPDENFAKAGMLKSIKYPTKGTTSFFYEINQAEYTQEPCTPEYIKASYKIQSGVVDKTQATFIVSNDISSSTDLDLYCTCNSGCTIANRNNWIEFRIYNKSNLQSPVWVSNYFIGDGQPIPDGAKSLPNGEYIIKSFYYYQTQEINGNIDPSITATFSLKGIQYKFGTRKVGGLRIGRIEDYDSLTNKKMVKKYQYLQDDNIHSSGRVFSHYRYFYDYSECSMFGDYAVVSTFNVVTSNTQIPLTYTQGGPVGYSKVTVFFGLEDATGKFGTHGKTDYYYSTTQKDLYGVNTTKTCINAATGPVRDSVSQGFPFAPVISADYTRGQLAKQIDYKNNNNTFNFVKNREIVFNYKDDYLGNASSFSTSYDVVGLKVGITGRTGDCCYSCATNYYTTHQYYYYPSRFIKLTSKEEKYYDDTGLNITQTNKEEYVYGNLNPVQLTQSTIYMSDGNRLVSDYVYPNNYASTNGFINDMIAANIIGKPVEVVKYLNNNGAISIISGSVNIYKSGSMKGLPDKIWRLETDVPVPLSGFKYTNAPNPGILPQNNNNPSPFSLTGKDNRYPSAEEESYSYNSNGNLVQINQKTSAVSTSYLWGYNNLYPVAKIINAEYNSVYNILSASDITTLLISNPTDSQIKAIIDKIRANATMEKAYVHTYTYKPLVGISSETDPNGIITFYQYDSFCRLQYIKDQDLNTIQEFKYHYRE